SAQRPLPTSHHRLGEPGGAPSIERWLRCRSHRAGRSVHRDGGGSTHRYRRRNQPRSRGHMTRHISILVALWVAAIASPLRAAPWAQAEPAPPDYVPPPSPTSSSPAPDSSSSSARKRRALLAPLWRIMVAPHLAVRFGVGPPGLPTLGFGAGVELARAL